jgi:CBS-domain-containing membrane protein
MSRPSAPRGPDVAAEALCVLFFALVVAAANVLQVFYIVFPELAALSSDVLLRPKGKWARSPWKLIATPVAGAGAGTLIAGHLPYGAFSILLAVAATIAIIFALRSSVAPAISAAVLPVVLGVKSWLYPLGVVGTLTVLAVMLLIWRTSPMGRSLYPPGGVDDRAVNILESRPKERWWLAGLFAFVASMGLAAQFTGWRFILFPPLIVMAYEMLGHPETCPWAKPPYTFPLACSLAALIGVAVERWLGVTPLASALALTGAILILRLLRLRMPPVLAIGLIPFVIPAPTYLYAASVAIGAIALTGWFLLFQRLVGSRQPGIS